MIHLYEDGTVNECLEEDILDCEERAILGHFNNEEEANEFFDLYQSDQLDPLMVNNFEETKYKSVPGYDESKIDGETLQESRIIHDMAQFFSDFDSYKEEKSYSIDADPELLYKFSNRDAVVTNRVDPARYSMAWKRMDYEELKLMFLEAYKNFYSDGPNSITMTDTELIYNARREYEATRQA